MAFIGSTIRFRLDYPTFGETASGPDDIVIAEAGQPLGPPIDADDVPDGAELFDLRITARDEAIVFYVADPDYRWGGRFARGAFNGWLVEDVDDTLPDILDVAFVSDDVSPPQDGLSFTPDSITLNVAGMPFRSGDLFKLDVAFDGPPPPPVDIASVTLDGTVWDVAASDVTGTDWSGSRLVFTDQQPDDRGLLLEGLIDWTNDGGESGREFFDAVLEPDGDLVLEGRSLAGADWSGLVTYDARIDPGLERIDGSWDAEVPGDFAATPLSAGRIYDEVVRASLVFEGEFLGFAFDLPADIRDTVDGAVRNVFVNSPAFRSLALDYIHETNDENNNEIWIDRGTKFLYFTSFNYITANVDLIRNSTPVGDRNLIDKYYIGADGGIHQFSLERALTHELIHMFSDQKDIRNRFGVAVDGVGSLSTSDHLSGDIDYAGETVATANEIMSAAFDEPRRAGYSGTFSKPFKDEFEERIAEWNIDLSGNYDQAVYANFGSIDTSEREIDGRSSNDLAINLFDPRDETPTFSQARIVTGGGDDTAVGLRWVDGLMELGEGDDKGYGLEGADRMHGGPGDDRLDGGAGDDVLEGGPGADAHDGGPGVDWVLYNRSPTGVRIDLLRDRGRGGEAEGDRFRSIENVSASNGHDGIWATNDANRVEGWWGADWIYGRGGSDRLRGGGGNDRLFGGWGPDALGGGVGHDSLDGQSGDDWLWGGPGWDAFIFTAATLRPGGHDRVMDFQSRAERGGTDWIRFDGIARDQVSWTQDGRSAMIHVALEGDRTHDIEVMNTLLAEVENQHVFI